MGSFTVTIADLQKLPEMVPIPMYDEFGLAKCGITCGLETCIYTCGELTCGHTSGPVGGESDVAQGSSPNKGVVDVGTLEVRATIEGAGKKRKTAGQRKARKSTSFR